MNLQVHPPHRMVPGMVALWGDDVQAEGTTSIRRELEPAGDSCRLTVTHGDVREGSS